jgi:hypothetical protein
VVVLRKSHKVPGGGCIAPGAQSSRWYRPPRTKFQKVLPGAHIVPGGHSIATQPQKSSRPPTPPLYSLALLRGFFDLFLGMKKPLTERQVNVRGSWSLVLRYLSMAFANCMCAFTMAMFCVSSISMILFSSMCLL